MIGYVGTGGSFFECIRYCLQDKKELTEEQKQNLAFKNNLQHKNRAEILEYNKCFGNIKELSRQFIDVAKLSKRVEKPVFHFALRLAPGETLTDTQLAEIGRECVKDFGVADNQYICVLHKDTNEQHIHVVANRVDFNGKVASDSNSYKRMAALCRKLEKQYDLRQVLSPRPFLSAEERLLPRYDLRREQLKTDIRRTLEQVHNYQQFEQRMAQLGYKLIKGRGISFIDSKKVKIKGSEVGFSLAKIEQILQLKQELDSAQEKQKKYELAVRQEIAKMPSYTPAQKLIRRTREKALMSQSLFTKIIQELIKLLSVLLKPEYTSNHMPFELTQAGFKKRKEKNRPQHIRSH
ncbi:MAG TPA: relaxase/mobilization nuclease domain-containing protein [Chitinophaga sp.]|uniref:relaxase/mobilization nuclease domain-containing protein n=1 Tax=Chitinophaga sp. TaxID=1869181 RepID=UPI002C2A37E9|nr:relaxase/mobilization nuclease domain-containing protein [Chitinophaga sp.]HVI48030.1 relaxase/mobilization nuclease domain-containing protein [Chitinophaga sp.]